jgi:Calcium binding
MEEPMVETKDIPKIPERDKRFEEILVDCNGQSEELAAMEVYFTDAAPFPFAATWSGPDEPQHAESVTVLAVAEVDERRGVLLKVKRGSKERRIVAEQIWANDQTSANAIILDDYRYWVNELYGLTPGFA